METATASAYSPNLLPPTESAEMIVHKTEDKALKVLFFPGNFMLLSQRQATGRNLGGKLTPEHKTVPNNYLAQCAFTPLKQGFLSAHRNFIRKEDWKGFLSSFTLTNQWNPKTRTYENKEVGADNQLLYTPIYPWQEIGTLTGANDGTTQISFNSLAEVKEAQFFFFPNWLEIINGLAFLPKTLRELKAHIQSRMEKTDSPLLKKVGAEMLNACDQHKIFGQEYIKRQTILIEQAKALKNADAVQVYDEVAEHLFEYLEITREDKLISNFTMSQNQTAEQSNQMTEVMKMMAQVLLNQQGGVNVAQLVQPIVEPIPQTPAEYVQALEPAEIVAPTDGDAEAAKAVCTFPKNPPCKGVVLPNTNPPRCVTHVNK